MQKVIYLFFFICTFSISYAQNDKEVNTQKTAVPEGETASTQQQLNINGTSISLTAKAGTSKE